MDQKTNNLLWELSHYLPLTGIVFLAHYYSGFLEELVVNGSPYGWPLLFVYYVVWIAIGDRLIHWTYKNVLKHEI